MMLDRRLAPPLHLLLGAIGLLFLLSGCEKPEERMLGKDAIPEGERMNSDVRDTFSIEARTATMPPVSAINSDPGMFGELMDARTGRTRSTLYSQLLLPGTNIDLGDPSNLALDSAVLSIRYAGYYGDTNTVQEFQVHQVLEDMDGIDPTHKDSLQRSSNPIGTAQKAPSVTSSVSLNGGSTTAPPQLRIKLKNSFGENILDRSGAQELSNDEAFTDFINGISISSNNSTLQNGEGAVLYGRVPHAFSRVTLYYRNTAQNDTNSLDLELGGSRFNRVEHSTDGSEAEPKIDSAFSSEQEKAYILGPGAIATELRFPTLRSLNDSMDIAVNKAVLELPVEVQANQVFAPANGVHILYEDASGDLKLTKDRTEEGGEFIGGAYESKDKEYRLRITRHIQAILNDEVPSSSVFVTSSIPFLSEGEANTVARSVLFGPGSSTPPRLELTYTEY